MAEDDKVGRLTTAGLLLRRLVVSSVENRKSLSKPARMEQAICDRAGKTKKRRKEDLPHKKQRRLRHDETRQKYKHEPKHGGFLVRPS